MGYSRFPLWVAVQAALIAAVSLVLAYVTVATGYYATLLLLAVVLAVQVAVLVRYVQRTNRELARFMLAVPTRISRRALPSTPSRNRSPSSRPPSRRSCSASARRARPKRSKRAISTRSCSTCRWPSSRSTNPLAEARERPDHVAAIDDAHDAVETIAKRSTGLVQFVDSYRKLTRLPKPELRAFPAAELLAQVGQLMQPELERRGITLEQTVTPRNLELTADAALLEQVLINLLCNAIDAVADVAQPRIRSSAEIDEAGHAVLDVEDNGHGMDEQVRQSIFVPFFTTKRHGTGIGLSLVRQIMRSHHGSVGVRSAPGEGTAVRLSFGVR